MSFLGGLLSFAAATAAPTPQPITIGVSHIVASKPLAQERTVNVVLPPRYAKQPGERYPVLYVIDGGVEQDLLNISGVVLTGGIWGRSADAIVVGLETRDRRRELVGPTQDPELLSKYPTAGSSAAFRAFIRDEVKPLIAASYRTDGRDAVIGESLAGLFVIETYMTEPELFDGYGAIDPSLWWDKEALSKKASTSIGVRQNGRSLYLAIAQEQAKEPAAAERVIARVPAGRAALCFNRRADLTHATIYQQLTPQMLQFLLPPVEPVPAGFGFEVQCSPRF